MKISEEIKSELLTHVLYRLHWSAAVTEYGGKGCEGIADVFGLMISGFTHELEVKVAKSDLQGELASIRYLTQERTLLNPDLLAPKMSKGLKHNIYLGKVVFDPIWGAVENRPNKFSYAVSEELREMALEGLKDTPYGLYVHAGSPVCVKKAAYLHKELASQSVRTNIMRKACGEVEILRGRMARGRRCLDCSSVLPRRCENCERIVEKENTYQRAASAGIKKGLFGGQLEEFIKNKIGEKVS